MKLEEHPDASAMMASSPGGSFSRVPALDGVRALATIAVLLFHNARTTIDIPLPEFHQGDAWRGGFLGVDVFFVLSGFLITTLLLREHDATRRIEFRRFWSRRARRLLPALFVLLLIEALLARYVFTPVTASRLRGDALGTLFYFENWRLATGSSPVLSHTWSLSIEEQWYLVWPLLLALFLYLARGQARRVLAPIAVLTVASAAECAALFTPVNHSSVRAHYGTDTRAQALLVGAALAVFLLWRPTIRGRLLHVTAWVALAFLVWSFLAMRGGDPWLYHGGFLLVAVASAVLIAAAVQMPASAVGRLLASRPLVAIGLVSYGLYLYHMPIYRWISTDRTQLEALPLLFLRLAVTTAVAVASYHLVEKPFRRGTTLDHRRLVGLGVAAVVAVSAVLIATPHATPAPIDVQSYGLAIAAQSTPVGVRRVLVAGDSAAFALALRTSGTFDDGSIRGAAYGTFGCDLVAGRPIAPNATAPPRPPECREAIDNIRQVTLAYNPAIAALMIGESETRDRIRNSQTIRFGTQESRALIVGALDDARAALTTTRARFVLLPVQCDLTDDPPSAKVRQLNELLAQYARDHQSTRMVKSQHPARCENPQHDMSATWQQLAAIDP
jgi:peptidoglycan/LPS O-acetylase OafA/YrhL